MTQVDTFVHVYLFTSNAKQVFMIVYAHLSIFIHATMKTSKRVDRTFTNAYVKRRFQNVRSRIANVLKTSV